MSSVSAKLTDYIPKAVRPLLMRTSAFLGVFILFSGLIGPRIISSGILYKDGFGIYGGAGKALLFAVICLGVLLSRQRHHPTLRPWRAANLIWLALAALAFAGAELSVTRLIEGSHAAWWIGTAHGLLLASLILALGGCFGPANLRQIAKTYRKPLSLALLLGIGFLVALTAIYSTWTFLAAVVLHVVQTLLRASGLTVAFLPPRTLLLTKFSVTVAEYCSGIESIALFTGFYILIGLLDWHRLNRTKLLAAFIPALLVLFALNILRVYVLILAGYYINPQIAFSLFHTYAGMLFFIIYSGIFWAVSYKWMLNES